MSLGSPAGHRDTRRHNLSLVLREALDRAPTSRAHLAEVTGLTKASVSSLVTDLLQAGLLVERGIDESGRVGRPGRLLEANGDGVVGVGLEVNVDYNAVCVLDLLGRVRHRRVIRRDNRGPAAATVVDSIARLGRQALSMVEEGAMLAGGVTVAVPGLVDVRTGAVINAPNLGWSTLPLVDMLTTALGSPPLQVSVDNEANLAALGELWEGRGREWGNYFHISGEIGVGAGLVVNGALMRGSGGLAGEFGHIQMTRDGPACPCGGTGCLERLVGQEAMLAAAGIDARLSTSNGGPRDGGVSALVAGAEAGHEATLAALTEAGRALGRACATVVNLLDPSTIVLGGIYAVLAPWVLEPLESELRRGGQVVRAGSVRVAVSELGPDAAVRGAASHVLRGILADPYRMPSRRRQRNASSSPATAGRTTHRMRGSRPRQQEELQ